MNKEEQELKKLEKRLAREYQQAYSDIAKKCDKYFAKFEEQDKKMKATLSHDDYIKWRQNKMLTGKRWTALRDSLAKDYTNVNQIAARMIREDNIGVITDAFNHGTYEVEKISGIDTNFTIYNRDSVENIIKNEPDLLPVNLNIPKDLRWNKSKVNSAIIQGILQGKPIKDVAKQLESVTDMNKNAAIRNARTMNTYARNVGRLKSYERADKLGVKTRKMWLATLDGRTRHSHRMMDREIVELDEAFSNGLMEPGDPDGAGGEIYNCRCRMIGVPQGVNPNIFTDDRASAYLDDNGISYEEWKKARQNGENIKPVPFKESVKEKSTKKVTNKQDAFDSLSNTFTDVDESVLKLNEELLVDNVNQFNKLNSRFGVVKANDGSYFSTNNTKHIAYARGGYRNEQYEISLSNKYYKKIDVYQEQYDRGQQSGFKMPSSDDYRNTYTITHEYGHVLEAYVSRNRTDFDAIKADIESTWGHNPKVIPRYLSDAYNKSEKNLAKDIRNEIVDIAKSNNKNFDLESNLSKYGHTNDYEFFAEVFANSQCGQPNELGVAMQQWLEKEGF